MRIWGVRNYITFGTLPIGALNVSESKFIGLTAHINGSKFGNLTNVVSVDGKPELGDNVTDSDTENVTAVDASIAVDKIGNVSSGSPSTRVNFTMLVTNTGNATLDPVVVTDTLPFGLDDPIPSFGGSVSGNEVTWNLGRLNSSDSRTVWLTAHINGSEFGNLTNFVSVEGKPELGDNVTDSDTENVTAVDASIAVDKIGNVSSGSPSTRVNFTMLVTNTGNATLDPVVVTDTLPFGLDDPVPSFGGSVSGNEVTWNLGRLNSSDSRTVWLVAHINGSKFGNLTNLVSVEGKPEFGDNVTDSDTENVTAVDASIGVDKSVNVSSGSASTRVNFTMLVTNTGNATLDPVVVTDTLPFGLDDPAPSFGGSVSGNEVTWNLGRLNSSDSRTVWLVAHINGSKFGNLTNVVSVEGKPEFGDNVTDSDTENVTAVDASIGVDKSVNVSSGSASTRVNFTMLVTNTGNATLDPVVVADTLPFGLDDPAPSFGGSVSDNEVTWNLGRLNSSDSRTVWLTAHINGSEFGNLTNVVSVEGKPELGDNVTDSDTENVTAVDASISIDKTANVSSGSPSTRVNFTMLVTNTGNATLDPVVVTDTLPFGLDDPVPSVGGSVSGNEVTWNLGRLNSSDSRTVWLTAHINGSKFGNLTNLVSVEGQPEFGDNVTDSDTENVTAVDASIAVDKIGNVSSGSPSTRVNFTMLVTNTGNATLDPVVVTDTLPFGLDDPIPSFGGSVSGNEVTWNLGRLNSSDSRTVWLTAHINGSEFGNLTNLASVEGKPEFGDNVTDSDTENVTAVDASIAVDKIGNVSSGSASTRVNFTMLVTNTGNATLDPVVVADTLPFGLDDPAPSLGGSVSGNEVTWNLGRLNSSDSRTVWLTAHINGSEFGNLMNVVSVDGKPELGDNVTDSDTENVTAVDASIAVDKIGNVSSGSPSTRVNFTMLVTNTGNATLDPVVVTDTLPFGLDDPVPSFGGSVSGNDFTWNLGRLNSSDSRTVWLTAHINGSKFGNLTNVVSVEGKPELGDNVTDSDTENVTAVDASIAVDKIGNVSSGSPSTRVNFTMLVTNTGNATLDPVVVTDTLPFGLDDPIPSFGGSVSGNEVTWNLGRLNSSDSMTVWLVAHINGSKFGNLTNLASVEGKPEHGDNVTDDDSENVTAVDASISIDKTANISSGSPSTHVNFTMRVTNTGNATLDPVVLTDTLPFGFDDPVPSTGGSVSGNEVTWNLGRLNSNDSMTVWLVAHINGSKYGNLTNFVLVEGKPEHGDNVTDDDSENVTADYASISVRKFVDIPAGEVCTNVTFTIVVNNTGIADLDPVIVTDTLPFGLNYVNSTPPGYLSANTITWNLGKMYAGEMRILKLVAHINGSAFGILTNLVDVEGKPERGDNVTDDVSVNVTALGAEIDVDKTVDISVGSVSTRVNFTILVSNTGNVTLDPVIVTDTLPYGLDDPVPSTGGSISGNDVTWNLGRLNASDTRTIWLTAHINGSAFGDLMNFVKAEGDPEFGDNVTDSDTENVTAVGAAIDVEKTVDIPVGSTSTRVNFTIVVSNTGNSTLDPVVVADELPFGLDDPVPSDNGSVSGNDVTWNLGRLNTSDSVTLYLEAHINGSKFGNLTNLVEVEGKPENGDNVTDSDSQNVTALGAEIDVDKTVDIPIAKIGTNVTFTILVKNTGSSDLDPVIVTDTLPAGLNYVNSTPPGSKLGDVITWNLGRLNSSDSRSIDLVAQITGSTFENMTNIVEVVGKPEFGDNVTDSDTENVKTFIASLDVNKTANVTVTEPFKNVNYTIVVTNTGTIELVPVIVTDILPAGIDYISAYPIPENDNFDRNPDGTLTVTWNLSEGLDPGESATIFLTGFVNGNNLNATNNVKVLGFAPDGSATNVTEDNETVDIYRLEVNKTAFQKTVKRGEEMTYSILICNTGTVPLTNVVVRDVFDKAVEFVSISYSWSEGFKPHIEMIGEGEWIIDIIPVDGCVEITLVVKVPKQDFKFSMDQGVSGEGFVNVAGDYSTTLSEYVIRNDVKASTIETGDQDYETVTVLGEPGTELSTREHGSGGYESEEQVKMLTKNKSISMDKDVSAEFRPTTLGLYNNRTVNYSSRWTEEAKAKNRITGASLSESYRYATSIDRESRMVLDKNESVMEIEAEFDGMGHVGFLKMPSNSSTPKTTPIFEARDDYVGSFKVLEKVDEYGSSVSSDKSASGAGLVAVDKRIGESQRSYESGTGAYDSEEIIRTHTNYIAKDISLEYAPASMNLTGTNGTWINQSMLWKEGMRSRSRDISYLGEEYTSTTQLDKETVARGLNEMDTVANFSGRARYRTVLRDEVDIDEQYEGEYSVESRVLLTGVPKYDRPHMTVVKVGSLHQETILDATETTLVGESRDKVITVATYNITVENDGNKALGPIYVKDLFPPEAAYINSSVRPSELTDSYVNWTLTHLAIGDVSTITLNLDVTKHHPDELVNRVIVTAGYNGDEQVTASNYTALEMEWLTCCLNETVSVTKVPELDEENPNVVMYRVDIKNWADVTRVATVTDSLPAGIVLIDSMVPFASYENNVVTWNLIEIGPFETVTIAYRVEAQRAGRFVNSVEVDARSVDGAVVQPVYASSVIEVGVVEECEATSCTGWQPPNWDFQSVDQTAELSCDELACKEK